VLNPPVDAIVETILLLKASPSLLLTVLDYICADPSVLELDLTLMGSTGTFAG